MKMISRKTSAGFYRGLAWLGLIMFFFPVVLSAENVKPDFFKANALYAQGSYDEAIASYEGILKKGYESGSLYYNLGNSYFKQGALGKALLNYEKAKKFIPRDRDLKANYDYARSLVKFPQAQAESEKLAGKIFSALTINEFLIVLTILYYLIAICVVVKVLGLIGKKRIIFITAILVILFVFVLNHAVFKIKINGKQGIVLAGSASAYYEPRQEATVHFSLFEGMKLGLLQCRDSWCKIQTPDKKVGWVHQENFEVF